MKARKVLRRSAAAGVAALAVFCSVQLQGQVPGRGMRSIPSLFEPGEGLTIRATSAQTGYATFASSGGRGVLVPLEASTPAEARALSFADVYGRAFGIAGSSQLRLMRPAEADALGMEHVRLQQVHQGVPVRGAEFVVHLRGARVIAANGHVIDDLPDTVIPAMTAAAARAAARQVIAKNRPEHALAAQYSEPRLEIFNRGLLSDAVSYRSRLAWFVEATGLLLREYIWIDAQSGAVLLSFSQLTEGRSRKVYNGNHTFTSATLVRSEGGPATGDNDQDKAYTYAGITYDYYLNNHGRDSFDNAGAVIVSIAHFCAEGYPQGSTCPDYQNAAWTGSQMVYADGFSSADDVVGHELTHAVTERTAGLFYYVQSGALNESYSDIFGETIDLTDGVGNDAASVRWKLGEDVPGGAIRDMMNPTAFFHPGKMSDSDYFQCNSSASTDPFGDRGGVHSNSGIPNHAFALMVDGGTYNDTTITGIGLTKAAKVEYRALTLYLTSGSGFVDNYNALNQACSDLTGTAGITASDCTNVTRALQAVEMPNTWPCPQATPAPPMCSTGIPTNTFSDTFETASTKWTTSTTSAAGGWSTMSYGFARGGTYMAFGNDPDDISDHRLTMSAAVTIPAGARMYFDHAFEFENGFFSYDGGVVEYSTNNGATWIDAGGLIDAGRTYDGTIVSGAGNPLGGRAGFVDSSSGYTGTRLNLASLAGQSVKFRFRVGSDITVGSLGWVVDNVSIYRCSSVTTGSFPVVDLISRLGAVNVGGETSTVTGNAGVILTDLAFTSSGAMWGIDFDRLYSMNPATGAATLVGSLGFGGMNALVGDGSQLLAASIESTSLYTVNTATGAATALSGSLGFPSMGDLAYHAGTLYAAVKNGVFSDLVRVTLSGTTFTATNLGHVTSDNALFGLAEGGDHQLYGLSGKQVLRINTANPAASTVVISNYAANFSGLDEAHGASSTVVPFTNDPLIAGSNIIRATHITELRNRIAALRLAHGLPAYVWNDPALTTIKAVHLTDLRTALSQVYTAVGSTPPTFTNPTLTGGVRVKAVHIMQLRAAVIAME